MSSSGTEIAPPSEILQPPQPPQSPQTPKGALSSKLCVQEDTVFHTVPDPDQLPRGLILSPAQHYVLRFLRESLEPCSPRSQSGRIPSCSDREYTINQTPSPPRKLPRISQGDSQVTCTPTVINFDSTGDSTEGPSSAFRDPSSQAQTFKIPQFLSPRAVKSVLERVRKAIEVGVVYEKRTYRYHSRVQKIQSPSNLRKKRLQRTLRSGNPFLNNNGCCKLYDCYNKLGVDYIYKEYKKVNSFNPLQCKRYLISLHDEKDNVFRMKGQRVCSKFLHDTLGFSFDVHCRLKGTACSRGSAIARCQPREIKRKTKRRFISNFITSLAKPWGDFMPHKDEITLPIFRKTTLWNEFTAYWEEKVLPFGHTMPSKNYFFRTWKHCVPIVKVRKHNTFTLCARCELFRSEMEKNIRDEETIRTLLEQRSKHLSFIEEERGEYEKRQTMAEEHPDKYFSLVIDGADQKNYGLPHFSTNTKSDAGHKMKVKVIGGLEHTMRGQEQLSLFAMTEEYETGANHIIEVTHRLIENKKAKVGKLPPNLFIQVDNCIRENKNRYTMAYFQSLVHLGVFKTIQVSFLPIGHTHADIDQAFSSISEHLRVNSAYTLEELMSALRKCYNRRVTTFELEGIANYSALCERSGCLQRVEHFSEYRFFRFMQDGMVEGIWSTICDVKVQNSDRWEPFPSSKGEGFLKCIPSLAETPATKTKKLPNALDVLKCLDASEERIKDSSTVDTLRRMREKVFEVREEAFHWNLETIFELRGDYNRNSDGIGDVQGMLHQVEEAIRPNHGYDPDDFVAVATEEDPNTKFWVGRVKEVFEVDSEGRAKSICIRWYTASGNDPWKGKYTPAWRFVDGEKTIYEETVEVACVLVRFDSLTTSKKLRVTDKKAIKQALDEN